tara:strand:+ start:1113 stop:1403 length:291 start_codon:yes stop_codon:yes gene_type:complete
MRSNSNVISGGGLGGGEGSNRNIGQDPRLHHANANANANAITHLSAHRIACRTRGLTFVQFFDDIVVPADENAVHLLIPRLGVIDDMGAVVVVGDE